MNQRLVWNFELTPTTTELPAESLSGKEDDHLKWEVRYFWQSDEAILLNTIDNSLLDLANYHQKHKEDYYYLLPDRNYNIKRRHNELLYKPLLQRATYAAGFGAKIILDHLQDHPIQAELISTDLREITQRIEKEGVGIYVKKEAFIFKFPTTPTVKLELARLEVLHKVYLSACVEGKSLELVETIFKHLLGEHVSCDYVTFLKNVLKL